MSMNNPHGPLKLSLQGFDIKKPVVMTGFFCESALIYCFLNSFSMASLAGFTYISLSFGFSILLKVSGDSGIDHLLRPFVLGKAIIFLQSL